jgi:FkbM family methyltransferase
MMPTLRDYKRKVVNRFFTKLENEEDRLEKTPRFTRGTMTIAGKPFVFHDSWSFRDTYKEIFERGIYQFEPHRRKKVILDCGANMGLSVLYFAMHYPDHQIIAFEPDETVFDVLETNVKTYELANVTLIKKAVWEREGVLEFYTDHGLGGRVGTAYANQAPQRVQSVRLKDYLNDEVGFLKVDIEGAESDVLMDCRNDLSRVDKIFFEYHALERQRQTLHELLRILQENDFHYYVKESLTRRQPFLDRILINEAYDMALNIFAYHPATTETSL